MKQLAEENMGLVGYMVSRMCLAPEKAEDAYGAGCLGLCKAALNWRENGGMAFSSFACHLIKHEILDFLHSGANARCETFGFEALSELFAKDEPGFTVVENRSLLEKIAKNPEGLLDTDELFVIRKLLEGRSIRFIAAKMGENDAAVYALRAKAAAKLREYFHYNK